MVEFNTTSVSLLYILNVLSLYQYSYAYMELLMKPGALRLSATLASNVCPR